MKCKLCGRIMEKGFRHCPGCKRALKTIRKIPKDQRKGLVKLLKKNRISIRRLLK